MKKLLTLLATVLLLFVPVSVVYAQSQNVTVSENEVVEKNPYFAAGENVHISGTVKGDAYLAGGTVTVDGIIEGDLLVAGGTVRVTGEVVNDIRAAGGQISIDGTVGGNATLAGGNIEISEDTTIGGSVVAGGGTLYLASPIGASAKLGGGQVTVVSAIPGDAEIAGESIRLGPGANVGGNFSYWSENDAEIDEAATVSGETTKHRVDSSTMPKFDPGRIARGFARFNFVATLIGAVSAFIVGFLLLKIYPNFTQDVAETISEKTWRSLGIGFAALFLFPIAFVLLLVTIVGIPLALILLAGYLVYIYVAKLFAMYWIGGRVSSDSTNTAKLLAGVIVYYLVSLIPFVRGFLGFFAMLFGFGALLITMKATLKEAQKKKIA